MNTKHKEDCKMAFGRKDPSCPRCQELTQGAEPRYGWGAQKIISNGKLITVSAQKAKQLGSERRSRAIHEHYQNHQALVERGQCHTMCTAFDW